MASHVTERSEHAQPSIICPIVNVESSEHFIHGAAGAAIEENPGDPAAIFESGRLVENSIDHAMNKLNITGRIAAGAVIDGSKVEGEFDKSANASTAKGTGRPMSGTVFVPSSDGKSCADLAKKAKAIPPGLTSLPAEIRNRIWKFALTADEKKFDFCDLRNSEFKPNVATSLLRVNREVYHDAYDHLYTENNFIFTDCGSDLRVIARPRGLLSCKSQGCRSAVSGPTFKQVTFVLGDNWSIDKGELKVQCFAAALAGIRCEVKIEKLTIYFRDFCWASESEPEDLVEGLRKLKVTRRLKMFGADFHWSQDIRVIPRMLAMNLSPESWCFVPGSKAVRFKGFFSCDYLPATKPEESKEVKGKIIRDPGRAYREYLEGRGYG